MAAIFQINSIEELISICSILDDNEMLTITGAQTKQFALEIVGLREDVRECHKLLTESGIPTLDQNLDSMVGVVERLKHLKEISK
jgi:hypothetical protein